MAMLFFYGPSADEMRATFKKHAEAGRKYMITVLDSCHNPSLTEECLYNHAVDSLQEIVPLLQSWTATTYQADYQLCAVYDLAKDYDAQKAQAHDLQAVLTPAIGDCFDAKGRLKPGPLISLY